MTLNIDVPGSPDKSFSLCGVLMALTALTRGRSASQVDAVLMEVVARRTARGPPRGGQGRGGGRDARGLPGTSGGQGAKRGRAPGDRDSGRAPERALEELAQGATRSPACTACGDGGKGNLPL